MTQLQNFTDFERIGMSAVWTDEAYAKLGSAIHAGKFNSVSPEVLNMLDTLCDGLLYLAANLNALNYTLPPPSIPSSGGLSLV